MLHEAGGAPGPGDDGGRLQQQQRQLGLGGRISLAAPPRVHADLKVGLALDVGGLGDKCFNDAAYAGAAAGDRRRPDVRGQHEADRGQLGRAPTSTRTSSRSPTPATTWSIGTGFAFTPGDQRDRAGLSGHGLRHHRRVRDLRHRLRSAQRRRADPPNVTDLTFKEQEGSYLVGVAAAMKAKDPTLRQPRLPRRPDRPADREVRGRLPGRRRERRPEHQGAGRVHRRRHDGVRRPDRRARRSRTRCTTTAHASSTTRPATPGAASSRPLPHSRSWRSGWTRTSTQGRAPTSSRSSSPR